MLMSGKKERDTSDKNLLDQVLTMQSTRILENIRKPLDGLKHLIVILQTLTVQQKNCILAVFDSKIPGKYKSCF